MHEPFSSSRKLAEWPHSIVVALVVALLAFAAHNLHAQAPLYRGYDYDSTFRMGAHKLFFPDSGQALHLEFTQTYTGPSSLHRYDPSRWAASGRARWADSLAYVFWRRVKNAAGFKAVFAPDWIPSLVDATKTSENQWWYEPELTHGYQFETRGATGHQESRIENYFVYPVTFPSDTAPKATIMVGRPAYTWQGLGYGGYYNYATSSTSPGWPGPPIGPLMEFSPTEFLPAEPTDYRPYFDLTVALNISTGSDDFRDLDTSSVLAFAVLYRRDTTGQTVPDPDHPGKRKPASCLCNYYVPFDTFNITKGVYLDTNQSRPIPGTIYREPRHMFKFPRWNKITGTDTLWCKDTMSYTFPEGADSGTSCWVSCNFQLIALKSAGKLPSTAVNLGKMPTESDCYYHIYTTQKVPITFLRARLQPHSYILLEQGRFDDSINAVVDRIYSNPTDTSSVSPLLMRTSITDEIWNPKYRPYMRIASKVQRRVLDNWSSAPLVNGIRRGLWSNPMGDIAPFRAFSGDLDSTDIKMVHMMAVQQYQLSGATPIKYANMDSMARAANDTYYKVNPASPDAIIRYRANGKVIPDNDHTTPVWRTDTARVRLIVGNSVPDHRWYTIEKQRYFGGKADEMLYAADIARKRFIAQGKGTYPVYYVAQVHGSFSASGGFTWRPPTPEEITAQAWLALATSMDGLVFSDFCSSAPDLGVMPWDMGYAPYKEFDTLSWHERKWGDTNVFPKMWLGFRSRFGAVRKATDEFAANVLPMYNKLVRDGKSIAANDTSTDASSARWTIRTYRSMPLLDTVRAEQASQFIPDSTGNGAFTPTATFDDRANTFVQATVYEPGWQLAAQRDSGVRYLLVLNRRTWPIDFGLYSDSTAKVLDTLARYDLPRGFTHDTVGLGNIDVRRPWVRLKNSAGTLYNAFVVERVGSSWRDTVPVGVDRPLQWLEPGWGAFYKVTPVRLGVSSLGTAYNNAVRSVTISDTVRRGQVVVYERDSIIYAQTMDSAGGWSKEFRISDTADAGASRQGWTVNPAVSTARNGTAWLFVWERINATTGQSTVRARYFPRFPHPDSLAVSTLLTFGSSRTVASPHRMTPAVTGVDSGFVVSWASATNGIESAALAAVATPGAGDISAVLRSKMGPPYVTNVDSLCLFPTLAYVRNLTAGTYQKVHLAWQQADVFGTQILYSPLRVRFPVGAAPQLTSGTLVPEKVTQGLNGCQFIHPSIAADSVRVGVAFQSLLSAYLATGRYAASGNVSVIVLRFRDSLGAKPAWKGWTYYWGNDSSWMEWPSVTQFPAGRIAEQVGANSAPQGALTWQRIRSAKGLYQQFLFRYGWPKMDTLPSGQYPTLTLVPFRQSAPFLESSSIFHRDKNPRSFNAAGPLAVGTRTYYDGMLINHPSQRHSLFLGAGATRQPVSLQTTLSKVIHLAGDLSCARPSFTAGMTIRGGGIGDIGRFPLDSITAVPDLPPSYFFGPIDGGGIDGATRIDTLFDGAKVTRTSAFYAGLAPVTIERRAYGSADLLAWLDSQPFDTAAGKPADIVAYMELVRTLDSAVIWRGDTVSARVVASGAWDDNVVIPVDTVAPLGTKVFIRQRLATTPGFESEADAGFWHQFDAADAGYLKTVHPTADRATPGEASAALRVAITPNPARSSAEVRVTVADGVQGFPAMLELGIYDVTGNLVEAIPATPVSRPGAYVLTVDVSGLTPGFYSVRARIGGHTTAVPLTVLR